MWPNPDAIWDTNADMVTFTEKHLMEKFVFCAMKFHNMLYLSLGSEVTSN